jgi:hypothetical protein
MAARIRAYLLNPAHPDFKTIAIGKQLGGYMVAWLQRPGTLIGLDEA